jgi:hypothetical protein
VVTAGPEFEELAHNELGGGAMASPVICGGNIFLRTGDRLVYISQ